MLTFHECLLTTSNTAIATGRSHPTLQEACLPAPVPTEMCAMQGMLLC